MAGSDAARADLFALLEQAIGRKTATALMDHIPPAGWPDFATKGDLALLRSEFEHFEERLGHRIELSEHRVLSEVDRRLRAQTWVHTSSLITGLVLVATIGRIG